jgi:hypothetical protein
VPILRLALLLCLVPLPSRAEEGRETARRLVREGNTLIGRGSCASALDRFQRAKTAYPASFKVEVNIGTALECLGRTAEATARFELFLDRADAGHPMTGNVRSKVTALRARVGRIAATCPGAAPGRVIVDGVESPLGGRAYVEPGSRRVVIVCGTLRRTEVVQLDAGMERELRLAAPAPQPPVKPEPGPASRVHATPRHAVAPLPAPPPSVPAPRRTPVYKRWWFWSVLGAVVVGATVGVVAATTGGSDRMPRGEVGHISID